MIDTSAAAFSRLHRDLARRRRQRLEPRLRVELALLVVLLAGFVFWQSRAHYASLAFERGPRAVGLAVALVLALLAVAGGGVTGLRLRRRLSEPPPGPAWLCLPIAPGPLLRHQRWEAESGAVWILPAALAAWCAAARLAEPAVWAAAAGAFPFAWLGSLGVGAAMARASVWPGPRRGIESLAEAWSRTRGKAGTASGRRGSFRRTSPAIALWLKDARLARRTSKARWQLGTALALAAASVALWWLPARAASLRGLAAPAAALLSAAAFGEWLVTLAGRDPFPVLRGLPVRVATIWRARAAWAALVTLLLVSAHAVAARAPAPLVRAPLFWLALASLSITLLAVHLQLTLFPRADRAIQMYGVALALAVACSVMIPFLGWVVLLAAVIHSARRLPRWWRLEDHE